VLRGLVLPFWAQLAELVREAGEAGRGRRKKLKVQNKQKTWKSCRSAAMPALRSRFAWGLSTLTLQRGGEKLAVAAVTLISTSKVCTLHSAKSALCIRCSWGALVSVFRYCWGSGAGLNQDRPDRADQSLSPDIPGKPGIRGLWYVQLSTTVIAWVTAADTARGPGAVGRGCRRCGTKCSSGASWAC
jgi:hypothetical protein